jgi:hypothetical protein
MDDVAELVIDGPFLIEIDDRDRYTDTTEDRLWTWRPRAFFFVQSRVWTNGPWAARPSRTCRPLTRARGQRPRRVRRSSGSRGDPPEPEPPLRPLTRAEREYLKDLLDGRRRRQLADESGPSRGPARGLAGVDDEEQLDFLEGELIELIFQDEEALR